MGTMQTKTLNRLQTVMIEHNFLTKNRQQSNLPKELKMTQNHCKELEQPKNMTFNNKIHPELFEKPGKTGPMVLSITDGSQHYG